MRVDDFQQTSIPGVYCAGEPTGIGGLELALVEGQIAGWAAGAIRTEPRGVSANAASCRSSCASSSGPSPCVPSCEPCDFPAPSFADVRMFPMRGSRNMGPGARPNSSPVAGWGLARVACVARSSNFFSTGCQTRCGRPFSPPALRVSPPLRFQPEPAPGELTGGPR